MTPQEKLNLELANSMGKDSVRGVIYWLDKGADLNAIATGQMNPPMGIAAANGETEVINVLLSRKADINIKNLKGQTPLHLAATCNRYDAMVLLAEKGADLNAVDNKGQTPAEAAKAKGNGTMAMFLRCLMARAKANLMMPVAQSTPIPTPGSYPVVDPSKIINQSRGYSPYNSRPKTNAPKKKSKPRKKDPTKQTIRKMLKQLDERNNQ